MKTLGNKVLSVGLINAMAFLSVWMALPVMQGCSSTAALAEVEKFEPVVLNVLNLACVIAPSAACGSLQSTFSTDYNSVVQLWGEWNTAVAAGTSTSAMWNDLNAAFSLLMNDSAQIFALVPGLNSPEITAIVASAQILLATIEALFPGAPAGATALRSARFSGVKPLPIQSDHGKTTVSRPALKAWADSYNGSVEVAHQKYPSARLQKVKFHKFLWV